MAQIAVFDFWLFFVLQAQFDRVYGKSYWQLDRDLLNHLVIHLTEMVGIL